jgi:uncharacterized protein (TIGR00730 family)
VTKKIKNISYFGFAGAQPHDPLFQEAYELSKYLCSKGFYAINGGGPGVMRAVSEGARDAGRPAVGVTFYPKDMANFEGRDKDNPLGEEIVTKNYLERTLKLLELGDVYVVFKGGTGTLSEFGMAWGLARLYFGHHKPLILYGDFWHNIIKAFVENMRIRLDELKVYKVASSPKAALKAIREFEGALVKKEDASEAEQAFQL